MGQAKTRRDMLRMGQPLAADVHRCPRCFSFRTVIETAPAMAMSHVPTLLGVCAECRTVWEAYPPAWSHDPVAGEPCDNCAFRQGSPESADRAEWQSMLAKLRHTGQEFRCHKGAPMILGDEATPTEFDAAWVRAKGRMCVGFLRIMRTWPDWAENRYRGGHVLTTHDQDRLLGDGEADMSELEFTDEGD